MSESEKTVPETIVNPPSPADESVSRDLALEFAAKMSASGTATPSQQQVSPSVQKDWALLRDPVYHNERLDKIRDKKGYIIDMDGVIYHVSSEDGDIMH